MDEADYSPDQAAASGAEQAAADGTSHADTAEAAGSVATTATPAPQAPLPEAAATETAPSVAAALTTTAAPAGADGEGATATPQPQPRGASPSGATRQSIAEVANALIKQEFDLAQAAAAAMRAAISEQAPPVPAAAATASATPQEASQSGETPGDSSTSWQQRPGGADAEAERRAWEAHARERARVNHAREMRRARLAWVNGWGQPRGVSPQMWAMVQQVAAASMRELAAQYASAGQVPAHTPAAEAMPGQAKRGWEEPTWATPALTLREAPGWRQSDWSQGQWQSSDLRSQFDQYQGRNRGAPRPDPQPAAAQRTRGQTRSHMIWAPGPRTWSQGDPVLRGDEFPAWTREATQRAAAGVGIPQLPAAMSSWDWDWLLERLTPWQEPGPELPELPPRSVLLEAIEFAGLSSEPRLRAEVAEIGHMVLDLAATALAAQAGRVSSRAAWISSGAKALTVQYAFGGTKATTLEIVGAAAFVMVLLKKWHELEAISAWLYASYWHQPTGA